MAFLISAIMLGRAADSPQARTRLVRPSSGRAESLWVGALVLLTLGAMALRFAAVVSRQSVVALKPYQRLDTELSTTQHLVYRSLLSGVSDIEAVRAQEGQWPEAMLLEEEGVPPFVGETMPSPTDRLQWVSYDGGTWVDYLGTDTSGKNRVSYILRLIDLHGDYHPHPHPGIDYDPELSVAAQVWIYDEGGRFYPGERLPEAGWFWLLSPSDQVLQKQLPALAGGAQD